MTHFSLLAKWPRLLLTLIGLCILCPAQPAPKPRQLSLLVLDGINNHDWQAGTRAVQAILTATGRFKVDVSTTPPREAPKEAWANWRPQFSKYNAVLVNFNGGHQDDGIRWPAEVEQALEQYVKKGGGLIVLHAANNAFLHWATWNEMIGLGWRDKSFGAGLMIADGKVITIPRGNGLNPGHGPRHDFQMCVFERTHPITRGLPECWLHPSEQLTHGQHGPAEGLTILTYAYSKDSKQNEPLDWVRQYGRGRVYTTMLGHTWKNEPNPNLEAAGFQTLLSRGAEWAATGRVTLAVPQNFAGQSKATPLPQRAAWLKKARWGVMTHFLPDWIDSQRQWTSEDWNKLIDGFDAEGIAQQLQAVGASYYLISIGQNSGFYLAPNPTYDKLTGIQPSKCARRDLVADLATALSKRGIKLMVYLPSGAPNKDQAAVKALGWQNGPYANREFSAKWEQIIRDWSLRWGNKIAGWWFDGCYWPNTMYRSLTPPNFESFAAAARAGNPAGALAFNPGVVYRTLSITPHEDYIAGEIDQPDRFVIRRVVDGNVDGAQLQMLSYLGQTWGKGAPRFTNEQVTNWTREIVKQGGAVTWDVPVQTNGLIAQSFLEQLSALKNSLSNEQPK